MIFDIFLLSFLLMLWVIVAHMVVFSSLLHVSAPLPSYSLWSLCSFSYFHSSLSLFLYSHFLSFPLVSPLHIFLSSCKPFMSSSAQDELRYKVMDACLCGTSLLIVFPPHLSLYLQPPEYIKILYLFYLYVNAPCHSFPLFSSVCAVQKVPPFALSFYLCNSFLLEGYVGNHTIV